MSSFLGGSSPSSSPQDMTAKKEAIMASVRNELAQLNAQQLMNNSNERCFKACVTKPGTSLSSSEETCLSRCLDRFMEAYNITNRSYVARFHKERLGDMETTLSNS